MTWFTIYALYGSPLMALAMAYGLYLYARRDGHNSRP